MSGKLKKLTRVANESKPRYTISTFTFKTLEGAKKQILKFEEANGFNAKTKIFKVVEEYEVGIKKVVTTKKVKEVRK